ncbi:MAG TPA: PKD domain-containing protein [Thermoanaerobaculia bacterium]|nr:PKD domain-containing protein [Thermoanaerobaculia bacterium]
MRRPRSRSMTFAVLSFAVSLSAAAQVPVPGFTYSPHDVSPNQLVQFTDISTPTPTSWAWTFGDPASGANNTSTLQNPTHVYTSVGVFPVTLTIPGAGPLTNPVSVDLPAGACQSGQGFLCLDNGRFQVNANWTKPTGENGAGTAVKLTDDSGYFWFFDESNIEMVVKVLDGCGLNGKYWVFAAGLTNVQVNWQVVDTQTRATFVQVNPLNTPFAPVQATDAFPTSCP